MNLLRSLRELLRLVGLQPTLGDEDAEVGALEAIVAGPVDPQEEAFRLVL